MERQSLVKTSLLWGLVLTAVLSVGAFAGEAYSGTCMFILMPYFAALAAVTPVARLRRFGAALGAYVPYTVIGFFPLFFFDWLQTHALIGAWAAVLFALSSLLIGLAAEAVWAVSARLSDRTRSILSGIAIQAATFLVMLLGLKYLYVSSADPAGHLRFFTREWFFTLPWMAVNGAFGGYTAWAMASARRRRALIPRTERDPASLVRR
jgi:hypothetical protein